MLKDTDMTSWFFNENFNGVADDFFDGQPFDFPSVLDNGEVEDWGVKFESIELPTPDALASLSSNFEPQGYNGAKKNLSSYYKTSQLNLEDTDCRSSVHQSYSFSSKESCVIQSSSPNSFLDSNSSSSNSAVVAHPVPFNPEIFVPTKRRNKRPRSSSLELWWNKSPASNLFLERNLNPVKRKERKTTKRKTSSCLSGDANRKCTHCHAAETPQWREGPKGPKTLCNACGVRYRSGRLLPEYRPLASPTFVASMHSNSHKKVAELRKKAACVKDVRDSKDKIALVQLS